MEKRVSNFLHYWLVIMVLVLFSSTSRRMSVRAFRAAVDRSAFPVRRPASSRVRGGASLLWNHPHRRRRLPLQRLEPLVLRATAFSSSSKKTKTTTSKKRGSNKGAASGRSRPYRLVIVESPSKCDTIAKILQQYVKDNDLPYDFEVTSCYGHIRNLPKRAASKKQRTTTSSKQFPYQVAGIDLDDNYKPTYVILPGKQDVVSKLRSLADDADTVLLATDPDREGEAMAWHLTEALESKSTKGHEFQRISFTEITPTSIVHAVQHPTQLNPHLIQAQETRRVLDRLAGFTVSPLLWKKVTVRVVCVCER